MLLKLILIVVIIECSLYEDLLCFDFRFILFFVHILKRLNVSKRSFFTWVMIVCYKRSDKRIVSISSIHIFFGSIGNITFIIRAFFIYRIILPIYDSIYHDDEEMTIWFFLHVQYHQIYSLSVLSVRTFTIVFCGTSWFSVILQPIGFSFMNFHSTIYCNGSFSLSSLSRRGAAVLWKLKSRLSDVWKEGSGSRFS